MGVETTLGHTPRPAKNKKQRRRPADTSGLQNPLSIRRGDGVSRRWNDGTPRELGFSTSLAAVEALLRNQRR